MKLRLGWGPNDGAEGMRRNIELIRTVLLLTFYYDEEQCLGYNTITEGGDISTDICDQKWKLISEDHYSSFDSDTTDTDVCFSTKKDITDYSSVQKTIKEIYQRRKI